MVLQGVISQQLIPLADGSGRVVATEIMLASPAISNLIRENKIHQISNFIQTGGIKSMKTMDISLLELLKQGKITVENALGYAVDAEFIKKQLTT